MIAYDLLRTATADLPGSYVDETAARARAALQAALGREA